MVRSLVPSFGIIAVVWGLYLGNVLESFENALIDVRFRIVQRAATADVLLVKIDEKSIQDIGVWPWPRSLHANLLDRLLAAGARTVTFDIDFSSHSSEQEDQRLQEAFSRAEGRVILPVFVQFSNYDRRNRELVSAQPLARFRQYATISSFNVRPDADGTVRQISLFEPWSGRLTSTLSAVLGDPDGTVPETFLIDYGIDITTIPQLSYVDALRRTFAPELITGRDVVVGATAFELGDVLTVPVWRALPSVVVQVLGVQSIIQDRALQRLPPLLVLCGILLLTFALGPQYVKWSWGRGLVISFSLISGMLAGALAVQVAFPVIMDATPWTLTTVLTYGASLVRRINEQDMRLLVQKLSLIQKDKFMQRVVTHTFDGIVTISDHGKILSFNRTAEQIFGYSADKSIHRDFGLLLAEAENKCGADSSCVALLGTLVETAAPVELTGRRQNGESFAIDVAVTDMKYDEQSIFIAAIRDISDRKRAEAFAAEAQRRLEVAIASTSEGFVLWDPEDRLVLCNKRFREFYKEVDDLLVPGWRFVDIIRAHAETGDVPAAVGRVDEWVCDGLERHVSEGRPYKQLLTNGRWLRISERRTWDGGIVGIITDITDDERREKALNKAKEQSEFANRAKTAFLANMSHELRTPLNAIIGFSEIIKTELLGPVGSAKYLSYATDIYDSGNHLLDVISDILNISQIESGKLKPKPEAVNLCDTIETSLKFIKEKVKNLDHRLLVKLDQNLPFIYADERLMKQTLINLLSNAVKFTPQGGSITVRASHLPTDQLEISVSDTGIGMTEEEITRALEPFGQVDNSLNRKYEGTGLGLSLVKSFVELHKASLDIDSKPDVGTTITIRFPLGKNMPNVGTSETCNPNLYS